MWNSHAPVLALDGPSGVGKGAVGREIAAKLGWHYLDSGVFYRVLAYVVLRAKTDVENIAAIVAQAEHLSLQFGLQGEVLLAEEDISGAIRTEACGYMASQIAAIPAVRAVLLEKQRAFQQAPGLVADGRDMGTVVFPEAFLKIFLEASAEIRAERRYHQLKDSGLDVNLDDLLGQITKRDAQDRQRAISPLCPAADARVVDTTHMDISAVVQMIMDAVNLAKK